MKSTSNPTTKVTSTPRRIILASAYRHEQHSTGRQERAHKALRKMGRFDDNEALENRRVHVISSTDEVSGE